MAESGLTGRACFEAINGPAPGKFLATEHGTTHYVLEGPESGLLVLLQHGLGSNLGIFNKIAADLVKMGMRVLRFDFYDRGYSETDPERYPVPSVSHPLDFTLDLYTKQVREVMTALGLQDKDYIFCGHSTGGVAAIGYASQYSDHLKGLLLMSSVCLPASKPLTARVADLPIVGSLIVKYFGANAMIKFVNASCNNPGEFPEVQEFLNKVRRNVHANKRYFASIRSTNAHCKGFVGSAEAEFRQFCKSKVPLHMIWGRADTSVPYSQCLALKKIAEEEGVPEVTETSFDGMPHNVFFVDAKEEECSKSICEFVSKVSK
eukprot:scaffold858_cov123-Cylindrotheca_fusiformis.AAC.27